MGVVRCFGLVVCLCVGIACGSKSAAPSDGSSTDAPSSDRSSTDSSSSDASPRDVASPDDMLRAVECGPGDARFDGRVPPDASCSFDDTDRDGVPDCIDGCPYDATKIAPATCGCGVPELDSDGDGIPDCLDNCPLDPNNITSGQCGCVGRAGLVPAGLPCTDTACPNQASATCNGAGVCGDRSTCSPCPGGHFVVSEAVRYWFCASLPPVQGPSCVVASPGGGPPATRMAAQSACAAKGLSLLRIYTLNENRFIARLLTSRVWLGANDLATPGRWYWPSATSDSDTQFWSGGADGGQENNLFDNWGNGAPGGASCASIAPGDGRWSDTDCNQTLGYICR